jgi:hypothetical protein
MALQCSAADFPNGREIPQYAPPGIARLERQGHRAWRTTVHARTVGVHRPERNPAALGSVGSRLGWSGSPVRKAWATQAPTSRSATSMEWLHSFDPMPSLGSTPAGRATRPPRAVGRLPTPRFEPLRSAPTRMPWPCSKCVHPHHQDPRATAGGLVFDSCNPIRGPKVGSLGTMSDGDIPSADPVAAQLEDLAVRLACFRSGAREERSAAPCRSNSRQGSHLWPASSPRYARRHDGRHFATRQGR